MRLWNSGYYKETEKADNPGKKILFFIVMLKKQI